MKNGNPVSMGRPRRRDRARGETWIRQALRTAPFGTLSVVAGGRPMLRPNLFVFDPEREVLYLHSARRGETRSRLEVDEAVAFSVSEMGRILPASEAIEFSVEYASVVIEGRGAIVDDEAEAAHALDLLMRKYAPQLEPDRDYRPASAEDIARTTVYRVEIERWAGKRNAKPAAIGAYPYTASAPGWDREEDGR